MKEMAFFALGVVVGFGLAKALEAIYRRRPAPPKRPTPEKKPEKAERIEPWFWLRDAARDRGFELEAPDGEALAREFVSKLDQKQKARIATRYGPILGWFVRNPDDKNIGEILSDLDRDIRNAEENLNKRISETKAIGLWKGELDTTLSVLLEIAIKSEKIAPFSLWVKIHELKAFIKHAERVKQALQQGNQEVLREYTEE